MKRIFILIITVFTFYACNHHSSSHQNNGESEHHPVDSVKVTLNNGNKWQANPETKEGIKNMITIINKADKLNADTLSSRMVEQYRLIIKRCTMDGEAHNQLHNYLLPLQEQINNINDSNKEQRVDEIKEHLARFSKYFE